VTLASVYDYQKPLLLSIAGQHDSEVNMKMTRGYNKGCVLLAGSLLFFQRGDLGRCVNELKDFVRVSVQG
jgi:hypothetical protein